MIDAFLNGFFGTFGVLAALFASVAVFVVKDAWDLWRASQKDNDRASP